MDPAWASHIRLTEESPAMLAEYAGMPIAFLVESRFRVEVVRSGLGGWVLTEEPVPHPYVYNYDQIEGEGPTRWAKRWDVSTWGILAAFEGPTRVGGAVIAWKTPDVHMLEGREDLACLWDIRVHPDYRRQGVGALLFGRAEAWARRHGCKVLKIETQDINIPACKFYARMGAQLRGIHPRAYPEFPEQVMLLWYRDL